MLSLSDSYQRQILRLPLRNSETSSSAMVLGVSARVLVIRQKQVSFYRFTVMVRVFLVGLL